MPDPSPDPDRDPALPAVIQAYFDAIRRKDVAAWCACFTPDAVVRDPADGPARVGEAAHRAFFATFAGAFDRLDFQVARGFTRGNQAALYFRAHCVHASGATLDLDGIDLVEIAADGRIAALQGFWDPTPLLALLAAE